MFQGVGVDVFPQRGLDGVGMFEVAVLGVAQCGNGTSLVDVVGVDPGWVAAARSSVCSA